MKVDPFIEAEKTAGHSVAQGVCPARGLQVRLLRAPQRRPLAPRGHRRRAARADQGHPQRIQGHLWRPAGPQGALASPRGRRQAQGDQAHASGRPRGTVQEALAQDHRRRPRRRGGPRPHPAPLRAVRQRSTGAMSATSPTSRPGRAGPTWPRSSTWPPAGSSAGPWPITCAPSWSKTPSPWPSPTEHPSKGVIFHSDRGCQYTSRDFAELARANGVVLSVGRKGECWDNAVAESFFRHHQARAHRHPRVADEDRTSTRRLRVHRGLVQHPPAALDARLPQPRPIRSCPPQRRPSGGIINTSNLSVEPDQAHRLTPWNELIIRPEGFFWMAPDGVKRSEQGCCSERRCPTTAVGAICRASCRAKRPQHWPQHLSVSQVQRNPSTVRGMPIRVADLAKCL